MAENGMRPGGENGTKTLAVKRETRMPHRKHAAVKTVQTTSEDRAINGAL
jgi:hypothetical protein